MTQFPPGAVQRVDPTLDDLTVEQLRHAMPRCEAETWHPLLVASMGRRGIVTPARVACYLAQIAVESGELRRLEEGLSYSAERLLQVWPSRFRSLADARDYERQPERLANRVYASRMGNGPEASGDGWRYRGRGPIQITGRAGYAALQAATGYLVVSSPDLLSVPGPEAAESAAWWWQDHGCNELADVVPMEGDAGEPFVNLTRRINGGTHGIEQRLAYLDLAREALS